MAERWVLTGETQDYLRSDDEEHGLHSLPSLPEEIEHFEKLMIEQALQRNWGNMTRTDKDLCIPGKTLYDKLQRHGIKPVDCRSSQK